MGMMITPLIKKKVNETGRIQLGSSITMKDDVGFRVTGSSAAIAYVGSRLFTYTPPSEDTDMITTINDLEALAKKAKSSYRMINLIDKVEGKSHTVGGGSYSIQRSSPFVHYAIDKMGAFDFFVKTVGVIPFGQRELDDYSEVKVQVGKETSTIRTVGPAFLMATFVNPVASTPVRRKRMAFVGMKASEEYESFDNFVDKVVFRAVEYVKQGEKVINEKLKMIRDIPMYSHVFSNEEYIKYMKKATETVPNTLEMEAKKIVRIANPLKVGKGEDENLRVVQAVIDALRSANQ